MIRRVFRASRANRDRRDQAFARFVIAEATKRHNDSFMHKNPTPEELKKKDDEILEAGVDRLMTNLNASLYGDLEVCPDCYGKGEVIRQIADGVEREAVCLECGGNGWVK